MAVSDVQRLLNYAKQSGQKRSLTNKQWRRALKKSRRVNRLPMRDADFVDHVLSEFMAE